jgi:hypothetical protein
MLNLARYLAILGIAALALGTESGSAAVSGTMQKEMIAAALIALLSLPNVLRWGN